MLSVLSSWLLWGLCLLLQNAAFTWTSRARNTDSLKEHGIASFFSNSVYFANLIVGVDKIREGLATHNYSLLAFTALFYTLFTMTGALYSHHLLLKRKRKAEAAKSAPFDYVVTGYDADDVEVRYREVPGSSTRVGFGG